MSAARHEARLALVILAVALFVFADERRYSHVLPEARSDITVALAAFLALLLLASLEPVPSWAGRVAMPLAIALDGLAAYRIGGLVGPVLVAGAFVLAWAYAMRSRLPSAIVAAALASDYALVRALADPSHLSPLPALEATIALVAPVVTLPLALRDERYRPLRFGLWLAGTSLLSLLTERYYMRQAPILAPDDVLLTAAAIVLLAGAALARSARWGRLAGAVAVAGVVLVALLLLPNSTYTTDTALSIDEAARALARGEDPYRAVDIVAAARARGLPDDVLTPIAGGTGFERRLPYPAGAFLPSLAFLLGGAADVRVGFVAVLACLYALLVLRSPRELAAYAGAVVALHVTLLRHVAIAGIEPSWALFLVLALSVRRARGPLAGLAAASRQLAWVYLPWLALDELRAGRAALARWLGLVLVAFVAVNGAFVVWDAESWTRGVLSPALTAYVPLGSGLVNLSVTGALPFLPSWAYAALTLGAAVVALIAYRRAAWRWRYGLAVLPVVPLFFAWRSLENYFLQAPLLLILLVAERERATLRRGEPDA